MPGSKCGGNQKKFMKTCSLFGMECSTRPSGVFKRVEWGNEAEEVEVLNQLLRLDEVYRNYYKDWLREFDVQRIAAQNLWTLTEVYCSRLENRCKAPKTRSTESDDVIINKYQLHYQIILASNSAVNRGLKLVRENLLDFRRACASLNLSEETPFNLGDAFHKPIQFFIDLAEELFYYFHSSYLKLDCGAHLLDPSDLTALEKYQKILAPCEEFGEYLEYNLSYCHCLRPSRPCPGNPMPRASVPNIQELVQQAKQKRCAQRLAKMSKRREESIITERIMERSHIDIEHEERMTQLGMRLAQLRQPGNSNISIDHENNLVQQVLYALSPSLMPSNFRPLPDARITPISLGNSV